MRLMRVWLADNNRHCRKGACLGTRWDAELPCCAGLYSKSGELLTDESFQMVTLAVGNPSPIGALRLSQGGWIPALSILFGALAITCVP